MTTPPANPIKESSMGPDKQSSQEFSKVWYYLINNEQKGPCLLENLVALYQRHEINDATLVWSEGMMQWMPLAVTIKLVPAPAAVAAAVHPTPTPTAALPLTPTYPPKKGFFISDKTVLFIIVVLGVLIWKVASVTEHLTPLRENTLTTVPSKLDLQTAQHDTSVNNAAVEQNSNQTTSDATTNQTETQTAFVDTANQSNSQNAFGVTATQSDAQTADNKLNTTYPASFDCTKAQAVSEKLICHDPELATADREYAAIYHQAKVAATEKAAFTKLVRKQWYFRQKNCFDKACIAAWYGHMKDILNQIVLTGNADVGGASVEQQNMYEYDDNGWRYDTARQKWVSARDDGRADIIIKYRDGRVKPLD